MTFGEQEQHLSVIGSWWSSIDRWVLAALAVLLAFGALLTLSAGPPAAGRLDLDKFHFVRAQLTYLPMALVIMLATSLLTPEGVRRIGTIVFLGSLVLAALTLVIGPEVNGARRWIDVLGHSLQPAAFLKPAFAVFAAWMFAERRLNRTFPGNAIACVATGVILLILVKQPDMGNAALVAAIWFAEFFVGGLSVPSIMLLALLGGGAAVGIYATSDHVAARVNAFLDPTSADTYQVNTALDAFMNGGLFGRGPGEGTVKASLPDAHSDFIFAVAGEELGLIACLVIVGLFAFIVLRGLSRMLQENNIFVLLAVVGLLVAFGLQALINMASTLHMVPTKGINLPFISYGGSSLLALGFGMGMVLALTRRPGRGDRWR